MEYNNKKHIILKLTIFIMILIILFILYGYFIGTKTVKVKEHIIINQNIPNSFYGFKIVQLSDINYGTTIKKDELKKIAEKVNDVKPDIIVITGDLLDSHIVYNDNDSATIIKYLNKMNATIGKYIVSGENDDINDIWNNIVNSTDFINLNNTYKIIYNEGYNPILLAGINGNVDEFQPFINNLSNLMENSYTNDENGNQIEINKIANYSILLTHNPNNIDQLDNNFFSLILAGHNHSNQINISIINTKYHAGHYNLENGELYVSNGIGTHTIPFRFLNQPTINVIV